MKKLLIFSLMLIVLSMACEADSDRVMRRQTEKQMKQMNDQIGMPAIKNYQERKLAKMIFELRDKANLQTYTYIITMTGRKIFLGRSIGYGLPYSIQYTNPMKYEHNGTTVPQADPNGLFMPSGLSATWIMLINPRTGKPKPVYVENEIVVSPFRLH